MADFRKLFYALAIVALFIGFTATASAQSLSCISITATNQIIRVEGDAELVGDIVLACTGSGFTTPPGTQINGADITVSIPSTIITSKVINPGSSTPISEATLIMDDLKDQTCNPNPAVANTGISIGNPTIPAGGACTFFFPGSRPHTVCADTTTPGGLGVCTVFAKASGSQDSYDGTCNNAIFYGSNHTCNPNIFAGQPNGTGAVIFRGVPLDPPATNYTRYIRITNIRVNAAATGLTSGNPLSQITAIIQFQGPASVQNTLIQTTVASIQTGNGGTSTTTDSAYLQCEYPLYTFSGSKDAAATQDACSLGSPGSPGTSSGTTTAAVLQGYCTASTTNANAGILFDNNPAAHHAIITFKEGFQTAWKARNMSEYLGTSGQVISLTATCALGTPCDNGSANNNNQNSLGYYTYNGSSAPNANAIDIAQNNPQIRFFTEGGFSESIAGTGCTAYVSGSAGTEGLCDYAAAVSGTAGFTYTGSPWNSITPGAGVADQGTRLMATLTNIPANSVVSLPTVVWLWNGKINSGVAVLVATTGTNGAGPISPIAPLSALPSVQVGVTGDAPTNYGCNGTNGGGPTGEVACAGYVDVSGPTATFVYEVIFSDPYSTEVANIEPVVYYPAGELTSVPPVQPQTNVWAQVSPYTFAPWIAQPGGNQTTTPLGQVAGTPRFVQTTGTALNLYYIQNCTCSLLVPWVVSDNNYVTGIVVANTSADPTNALSIPGYTAVQESGTVNLYLFGTIGGKAAQTNTSIAASYNGSAGGTAAPAGGYATFIVNTGFDGYAITQANFQYCHGLAFLFNATGAVPPVSYIGNVMDPAGLTRTTQTVGDPEGQ